MADMKALMRDINKRFGKEVLQLANNPELAVKKISTGSLIIDDLLGGGFALGRSVELYGDWAAGKTYIALCAIAEAQARGMQCAYLDIERALDVGWAETLGVRLDELVTSKDIEYGDEAIDLMEALLRLGEFQIIALDSVAALLPRQEGEKRASETTVGQMGKLMSKAMRKLTAANKRTVLVFINQTREKIGIAFGNPTTTPGGKALGFYASQRLLLKTGKKVLKEKDVWDDESGKAVRRKVAVGQYINVSLQKDKTGKPFGAAKIKFDFEQNRIDPIDELITLGCMKELIRKDKRTYEFYGDTYGSRKKLYEELAGDNDLQNVLRRELAQDMTRHDKT